MGTVWKIKGAQVAVYYSEKLSEFLSHVKKTALL
jgi:hypothetical protein